MGQVWGGGGTGGGGLRGVGVVQGRKSVRDVLMKLERDKTAV